MKEITREEQMPENCKDCCWARVFEVICVCNKMRKFVNRYGRHPRCPLQGKEKEE